MLSSLPAPKRSGAYKEQVEEDADETQPPSSSLSSRLIPAYPHRGQWVPTEPADFGDGGAYPEIHCVQFPLNMGRRSGSSSSSSSALVAVEVNRSGQATHDALVKQGLSSTQRSLVQTSLSQAKEVNMATLDRSTMSAPSREEAEATAERTRIALQALMEGKLKKASSMSGVGAITTKKTAEEQEPTYIRYTANPEAPGYNPAAKQRVIKMVDAQVDPMDPSKVQFKKVPKGPPPPPVPVLHSPPRKLTAEDQQAWKIPPCVSNWKNAQGFIIALDKRLAADGRGLQEVTINNKFASLSEALYVSERKAAEDLLVRNQIRKKMAMKEKEDREAQLRELASRARMERGGLPTDPTGGDVGGEDYSWRQQQAHIPVPAPVLRQGQQGQGPSGGRGRGATLPAWMTEGGGTGAVGAVGGLGGAINAPAARSESNVPRRDENSDSDSDGGDGEAQAQAQVRGRGQGQGQGRLDDETEDDRVAREQREALRIERRKERERELRMQNLKGARKNAAERNEGRDVSEKIALGMHTGPGAKLSGDGLFDARLFNQSSGMDAGFGAEEDYNTYTKPLFDRDAAASIYRPKRDDGDVYGSADTQIKQLQDTSRFRADKGFAGAEGQAAAAAVGGRSAPVQFEKAKVPRSDDDVFGLDELTGGAKKARRD